MKNTVKALIFDLDGTVADTIWAIRAAVNQVRAELGLCDLNYDEVRAGLNNGARNLVKVTIVDEAHREDDAYIDHALSLYLAAYARTYTQTDEPYEGMREALAGLKARGYRLAMLSNKPDRFVRVLADKLFGDGVFEVARGPVSNIVKPDPRLSLEVLAELDPALRPEDCAMIGDSDIDILTAKNAGMAVVGCAWGYRGREYLENFTQKADIIIDKPIELLNIF